MTGLFAHQTRSHRGPGPAALAARRRQTAVDLDAFADALAEGGDLADAARKCGISIGAAESRLKKLRKGLGWQAR